MKRLLSSVALLVAAFAAACGARQHIPLDAPQYEEAVGPAADAGTPRP